MDDWAEIGRLFKNEKLSQRAVAEKLGVSRETVKRYISSDEPPKYERKSSKESIFARFESQVRALLQEFC